MTTPPPTTAPTTATPDQADVDQALAARAVTDGERIAGYIAAAMLDTVGQPTKLPQLLFPDLPAEQVQQVWQTALTVGLRAGRLSAAPRFYRDTLARLQTALAQAGYEAMARTAHRAATAAAAEPEPDHERSTPNGDGARGDHW